MASVFGLGELTTPGRADTVPPPECGLEDGDAHAVARVVDAQTLMLDDGREVRLIGLLPPLRPTAVSALEDWPPERDALRALELLVRGRSVELRYGGRRTDRYGRLLAHVFVDDDGNTVWVQGTLIAAGHGRAYALPGNDACLAALIEQERRAREQGMGLWHEVVYGVRRADDVRELGQLRGRFEIVEGRVEHVAEKSGHIYLDFGSDWHSDFTASLQIRLLKGQPEAKAMLLALEGKRVRVRGWIEWRNGPYIELSSRADVEMPAAPDSK